MRAPHHPPSFGCDKDAFVKVRECLDCHSRFSENDLTVSRPCRDCGSTNATLIVARWAENQWLGVDEYKALYTPERVFADEAKALKNAAAPDYFLNFCVWVVIVGSITLMGAKDGSLIPLVGAFVAGIASVIYTAIARYYYFKD